MIRNRIFLGSATDMSDLPDESVHCVVTSPPYFGVRKYPDAERVWGGERDCPHVWSSAVIVRKGSSNGRVDLGSTLQAAGSPKTVGAGATNDPEGTGQYRRDESAFCECGAWYGQLGLEPTPALYVAHLVAVFAEVRRVLRSDGTAWLNLGDCYAGSWGAQGREGEMTGRSIISARQIAAAPHNTHTGSIRDPLLKPKDLIGMPWRVALALQADGWWLRSDIIWAKNNPMPESVSDRPTHAHEYVFLLAKSERYYYDADAIREPLAESSRRRLAQASFASQRGGAKDYRTTGENPNRSSRKTLENLHRRATTPVNPDAHEGFDERWAWKSRYKHDDTPRPTEPNSYASPNRMFEDPETIGDLLAFGANRRSVWEIPTTPYPGAHFATFPPELARDCILAGCPVACCASCGAPWQRTPALETSLPTCGCTKLPGVDDPCDRLPGLVLDPFMGSGTTAFVAVANGRAFVGYEVAEEYRRLALDRLGLFGGVEA